MQDDIYIDSETELATGNDLEETQPTIPQEKISQNSSEPEVFPQPLPLAEQGSAKQPQNVNIKRNVRSVKNGWRSQIAFL